MFAEGEDLTAKNFDLTLQTFQLALAGVVLG
jgi:hypothetical protein